MSESTDGQQQRAVLHCSFCGKASKEVKKLVEGPSVRICDECVALCVEIMNEPAQDVRPSTLTSPRAVYEHLDEFVCGQEHAKQALAVAMYRHKLATHEDVATSAGKNNILISGPTGSGKTFLIRSLAKLLDIPFTIVTATAYTQAGYVGEDVEDMVTRLIEAADGDVERAKRGIIFIDEIDKLARADATSRSLTRDVSGEGVQQGLLTMLEGATVNASKKTGNRRHGVDLVQIDTDQILFVGSGAFVGLEKLVERRIRNTSALMAHDDAATAESDVRRRADQLCERAIAEDFVAFGLIPEFAGRFTHYIRVRHLYPSDLVSILRNPKSSPIPEFESYFALQGITIKFTDQFYADLAHMAVQLGTGARGLKSILMRTLVPYMYKAPDWKNVKTMILDHAALTGGPPTLLSSHGIPLMKKRDKAFLSYAHEDAAHMDALMKVVKPLLRKEQLAVWSDKQIDPGREWRAEIDMAMSTAKVAIFLVSASFLASEYALKELDYFLSVHEAEEVTVLWLLVSPCLYEESPLERFQAVHSIDRPLSAMSEHERAELLVKVARLTKERLPLVEAKGSKT